MTPARIVGLITLAVGIILLGFGIHASQAVADKVVEGVTGRYTNETMWYLIGGVAMIVGGGTVAFFSDSCKG